MSHNEVLAVVAHELGHWKNNHSKISIALYCAKIYVLLSLSAFFRSNDAVFLSFGFTEKSTFIGTALFFNLFSPINSFIDFLKLAINRYFEF